MEKKSKNLSVALIIASIAIIWIVLLSGCVENITDRQPQISNAVTCSNVTNTNFALAEPNLNTSSHTFYENSSIYVCANITTSIGGSELGVRILNLSNSMGENLSNLSAITFLDEGYDINGEWRCLNLSDKLQAGKYNVRVILGEKENHVVDILLEILNYSSEKFCSADYECACGIHIKTGACFYGNKNFVDTTKQCPDFCTGIASNFEIKCIDGECKQINKLSSEKFCSVDSDCACGIHIKTGACFYGNKNFVDTTKQCPDFCTGIASNFEIKCIDGECKHKQINKLSNDSSPKPTPITTDVVEANNQFAFELYSKYKDNEGNIFFSPYSISTALAMTYEGARGKTAEEIQAVFHFPKDANVRRQEFTSIYNQINKPDKQYELKTANALWAQKDYKFLDEYFKTIEQYYGGKVTNLDFTGNTENSRITINNWVEEQTNDKIKNLIPPESIDSLTRLVITNAVYFKANWSIQFDAKNTYDQQFKLGFNTTTTAKMMHQTAYFNYSETDEIQILEMDYLGNDLSMLVILPKDGHNIDNVGSTINMEKLNKWKSNIKYERVAVAFPKFKFEIKYFMKGTLSDMGMPSAFSMADADFSGMTGTRDLFISAVIHQAFVDVNEEGTEAAAATAVVMRTTTAPGKIEQPKIFNADHPFIFIIQDKKTGNILFLGRVTDPSKN